MRCCGIFTVCVTTPLSQVLNSGTVGHVCYPLLMVDSFPWYLVIWNHGHTPLLELLQPGPGHISQSPGIVISLGTLFMLIYLLFPNHSGKINHSSTQSPIAHPLPAPSKPKQNKPDKCLCLCSAGEWTSPDWKLLLGLGL